MAETPLTSARHLKIECLKITAGQRVRKVSMSSQDVVGAWKVCAKPNNGGHKEPKTTMFVIYSKSSKKEKDYNVKP